MDLAGYRPTLNEVAALFGKSSRWISDLRAKGEMPDDGGTLKEFVAALASASAGKGGKAIDGHKARLAAAKADQAEMEIAALRGELLPRAGVTQAVQGAFARVRAKMIGLPSKGAPIVAALKGTVAIQERLSELVHEALAELAATEVKYAADDAAPGDMSPAGGAGAGLVAGDDAAPAADGQPVGGRPPQAKPRSKRRARGLEDEPS